MEIPDIWPVEISIKDVSIRVDMFDNTGQRLWDVIDNEKRGRKGRKHKTEEKETMYEGAEGLAAGEPRAEDMKMMKRAV